MIDQKEANLKICDYLYKREEILTDEDLSKKASKDVFNKIADQVMDRPILINSDLQMGQLRQSFRNHQMLVVYCDPKIHGKATYDRLLKSLSEARKKRAFR